MKTKNLFIILLSFLIIIGSSIPGSNIPSNYFFKSDKLLHVLEYFIFGYFLIRCLCNKSIYPFYLTFFLGVTFALADEIYQSTVFGRFSSVNDVIADTIGLILSIIFYKKISKIINT
tara:strand:- start:193 stop:543 length:351 start_codon:yes stop_codon:yes gene_type:complete